MAKIKKQFLTPKWLEIKTMYEEGTNGSDKYGTNFPVKGELNELSNDFVDILGELTRQFGWECIIEEVHMNLWKERIWSVIENAGLLPEIAWRDDQAKDEEIAAKKLEEDEDSYDFNDYEPSDEEILNQNY
jgi:hypothetical protein|tara:strand:- start:74 stop:466 length:393 start_codon:yes stop_codon:yes gene_type:complete